MSSSTYSTIMRVIAAGLGMLVAASIVAELPLYIPVIAIMIALVAAGILRRRVKDIMVDERNIRIYELATGMAYRIFTVAAAAISMAAMTLRSSLPEWAFIAGQTIAYSVIIMMLIHLAFTSYYSKKL
jgi:uncharacterized membrane protein